MANWKVAKGSMRSVVIDENCQKIAEVVLPENVDVIAAATELLDRLKISTVQMWAAYNVIKGQRLHRMYYEDIKKAIEFNEAAIAKAEGK